jgi:hypothetical protein
MSYAWLFLAVIAAIQPRLINSASTKYSPAFPISRLETDLIFTVCRFYRTATEGANSSLFGEVQRG